MIKVEFDELYDGDEFSLLNRRYVRVHRCKVGKKYFNAVALPHYKTHLADDVDRLSADMYKNISGKEYVEVNTELYVSRYNRMNLVDRIGFCSSGLILDIADSLGLKSVMVKALKYDSIREALND